MRLEKQPGGIRITAEDEVFLDLTTQQYEDIFYAIPLDSSSLYLLLNGTVLTEADDRAILQFIVEANGGVDSAMKELQELVQATPPPTADVQVEPKAANSFDSGPAQAAPSRPASAVVKPIERLPEPDEEPFEIVVQPTKPAVDPFAAITSEASPDKPFEVKLDPKPPTQKPPESKRPGTQVFSKHAAPPIKIEPQPDGKRVRITVGSKILDMGVVRYEDLYYAVPGDNASLFRLMNDTILNRPEERDALKDMLGLLGGIDPGMTALQAAVQKVEPPPKKQKSTPPLVAGKPGALPTVAPAAGPKTASLGGKPASPAKPPSVVPALKPASVAGGIAQPAAKGPGIAPAAAVKTPVPPSVVKTPGIAQKPGGPTPGVPGSGVPKPAGVPPKVTGPRPFTVDAPDDVDDVELVDDVEELPVAPVETRPGAPPAAAKATPAPKAPVSKAPPPAAPKSAPPQPAAPSGMKRRGKEIDRPAGQSVVKMSKEDIERSGVKVKAVPNVGYQIICKEYFIQLSKQQYQELHYALPMPVMNMFKLVHNDLLKDPQSRGVLMKMIHLAGGPKEFMSALSIQVQAIKPTENWQ